jgi:endo-1,4-beta-D-glucanase Y
MTKPGANLPFLSRRALLAGLGGAWPAMPLRAAAPPDEALRILWQDFRARFMLPEGRIVDTGNQGVSHSEGQGWALLCAERCGDRASFELLLAWTRGLLRRPGDHLHAWRHVPGAAQTVSDRNNATDGDVFIAAALLLAARRWDEPAYAAAGTAIARDVLRLLLRRAGGRTVLLPGAGGFEEQEHVVLNLSYYAFPALRLLAQAVPDPAWLRLVADGMGLLRGAGFGRWELPPDWLTLWRADGVASLPARWPPRFSYDAIRVPLYLAWAGLAEEVPVQRVLRFWADRTHPYLPAWADLETDRIAPYPASGGVAVLRQWLQSRTGGGAFRIESVRLTRQDDYYGAMIKILTLIANRDLS